MNTTSCELTSVVLGLEPVYALWRVGLGHPRFGRGLALVDASRGRGLGDVRHVAFLHRFGSLRTPGGLMVYLKPVQEILA